MLLSNECELTFSCRTTFSKSKQQVQRGERTSSSPPPHQGCAGEHVCAFQRPMFIRPGLSTQLSVLDIDRFSTEQMEENVVSFWCKNSDKRPIIPTIDQGPISKLYPLLTPNF